jgi:hypothetical protein
MQQWRRGVLDAKVSGRELTFSVPGSDICAGGDYWWESLSPYREWFEVCGGWSASVNDPQLIAGVHVGTFAYHHLIDPSARVLGDIEAASKGPGAIAKRIERRWIWRIVGRWLGRLTR